MSLKKSAKSTTKKTAVTSVTTNKTNHKRDFTENELQDLRTAFGLIDANQDGQLHMDELNVMLKKLGIEVQERILEDLVRTASRSGQELLDETEFFQWVAKIQELLPDEPDDDGQKDLMAAFRVFDLDQNGFITMDELRIAMETIGEPFNEEQLTEFLILADTDRDGKINYEGKEIS